MTSRAHNENRTRTLQAEREEKAEAAQALIKQNQNKQYARKEI